MLEYLLKSSACMAAFLLFYRLLLEQENMHTFKRFFLLGSISVSLIIPTLVFTAFVEVPPSIDSALTLSPHPDVVVSNDLPATDRVVINWKAILISLYVVGFTIFGFRFSKHVFQMIQRIRKNPKRRYTSFTQVLLQQKIPPHTFFSYIFLNKQALQENAIPSEVLIHEETHAKQYHSIDVLFIELLQWVFWFNPLLFLYKKNIKLNHEFLADSAVLNQDITTTTYQNILLSYVSKESAYHYQSIKMANAINYSSTRKRFTVMKKKSSKTSVALRTFLVFPMLALLLYSFSEKEIITREFPTTYATMIEHRGNTSLVLRIDHSKIFLNGQHVALNSFAKKVDNLTKDWEEIDSIPVRVSFNGTPTSFLKKVEEEFQKTHFSKSNEGIKVFPNGYENKTIQIGASREQMKEYNALARKYNEMPRDNMHILGKEVARLEYLYGLMSDKQREDAEPFPKFPEPPLPPEAAMVEQFKKVVPTSPEANEVSQVSNIPPPPESTMVTEFSHITPEFTSPPPAPKATNNMSDHQYASNKIDSIVKNQDPNDEPIRNNLSSTFHLPSPPPPPTPPSPIEHIIEMAKKGATFHYQGKQVSSDTALELVRTSESLNIRTTKSDSKNPQILISGHSKGMKKE